MFLVKLLFIFLKLSGFRVHTVSAFHVFVIFFVCIILLQHGVSRKPHKSSSFQCILTQCLSHINAFLYKVPYFT